MPIWSNPQDAYTVRSLDGFERVLGPVSLSQYELVYRILPRKCEDLVCLLALSHSKFRAILTRTFTYKRGLWVLTCRWLYRILTCWWTGSLYIPMFTHTERPAYLRIVSLMVGALPTDQQQSHYTTHILPTLGVCVCVSECMHVCTQYLRVSPEAG